jgi:hypothetical protein
MDPSTMTFEEILFNNRYHIIGAVLFAIFFGVFIHETVKEAVSALRRRAGALRGLTDGPVLHDAMLGATMTDGGEPVAEDGKPTREA